MDNGKENHSFHPDGDYHCGHAALETKLTHNLDHELDRFSKEIKDAIAQEILKRYYFQRGAILQRLKDDPDLKKAIEILNNQSEYSKILSVMK